jgi:hypothetical protein
MKKSLFSALVVGLCITANLIAQVPNYVPTNGLVGWWPFNGNANDESGNGNDLTNNGGVFISDRNGTQNSACGLSNVGTSLSASNVIPSLSSNLQSISYWVQLPTQYNYSTLTLATNGVAYTNGSHLFIDQNDGAYGLNNYVVGILISNGQSISFITNQSELGNWNNVVFTYDGNQLNIYFNGILKSSLQYSGALNPPNNDLLFANWGNPSVPTNTTRNVDDIGIWNRALTNQEIGDLYNATNCENDLTISPTINSLQTGNTANFTATISDANATFTWQSDFGQGFQTLNNVGNYSGTTNNTLSISNVQLANHNQPIRAISSAGNCTDTSNIATIQIADTCITTIYDTLYTTVTDTLIINTTLSLPAPNNENTILIYPNPASDHITIDNGNFAAMAGYSIKIENNAGQQVFQSLINQAQFYVDLSTWTGNGLYFVHLIDPQNNTVTVRKIVLQ